jgi:hypothetical protein
MVASGAGLAGAVSIIAAPRICSAGEGGLAADEGARGEQDGQGAKDESLHDISTS